MCCIHSIHSIKEVTPAVRDPVAKTNPLNPHPSTTPSCILHFRTQFCPQNKNLLPQISPPLPFTPSPLKPRPSSQIFHPDPATGYAAALVDVAHNSDSLHFVHNDVQRLLKLLQNKNFQSPAVEHGNFHRHVVALLKMLLKKNKAGTVKRVLQEFERIYDELCGTQTVLVSSKTKMGEDQLFGIAKSVHQWSGAVRVKVKNLVQESLPSFAV
ncbi:ATP synthase delta chain [Spatholobus suberectus]|nr:ATP synthase delta chain [Spatholobus suberectus]